MPMLRTTVAALLGACMACSGAVQTEASYRGEWHGPFLFYVVQADTGAQGPPAVYEGKLRIDADGAVRGRVPEAACELAGSSSDYVSPVNATLELTLTGCKDIRFNTRFSGRLIGNPPLKYASLRLSAMRTLDSANAQLSAIIRR